MPQSHHFNFTVFIYDNRLLFHDRKGRLHFVDEKKAKVNVKYYVKSLLPSLVADCNILLPLGFIFEQDGTRHTHRLTLELIAANYPEFCSKDQWPQIHQT